MTQTASRPVLLTVDDDPSVSRAVARDLRRHYGERYRVVRADDGASALDALRALSARGDDVALLLADHRMPGMTGVEFLEQAMDLVPSAKRVLLTAYAETDAAIRAINEVDLDRYLLKPWDPPEERLYPVLDDLLASWQASRHRANEGADVPRLLGSRWSSASHDARDLLARNGVPHRFLDVERDAEGRRLLAAAGLEPDAVPVLMVSGRPPLARPDRQQLAEAVGLPTALRDDIEVYDLVVVGAGPGGLGAAVYGASEGLSTLVVESEATGGQAGQSSRIENYLGFPRGLSGGELAGRALAQAQRFSSEFLLAADVAGLEPDGPRHRLLLEGGREVLGRSVVLATGVSYRRLEAVDAFTGRGAFYGAATTEGPSCAGTEVVVVGGANSAGQAAVYFADYAERVHLVVRADDVRTGMSEYLVRRCVDDERIVVRTGSEVVEARGEGHLQSIVLATPDGSEELRTEHVFVFIGAAPRTAWLEGSGVARDGRGFVLTGPDLLDAGERPPGWDRPRDPWYLETSVPGVYAAGDVRAGSVKRVASAVGEGAMAVTLVHRYLADG